MTILQRFKAPTPKLFKKLRAIGLSLAAVGTAIIGSPIALPAIFVTVSSYLIVAGAVLSAVSQVTVEGDARVLPLSNTRDKNA